LNQGTWLQPRHGSKEAFEKDYPKIEQSGLDVACPGCKGAVKVIRRAPNGKLGGWCKNCNRGVGA
jgi:hypothetical protein